jgi:ribosomal protein S18 acetylase RimI-like enzyme
MDVSISEVDNYDEKSSICNDILRTLPEWFANEDAIVEYAIKVRTMPFYAAFCCGKVVGFIAIKTHNKHTAEICVMGILPEYHRKGIGKRLILKG